MDSRTNDWLAAGSFSDDARDFTTSLCGDGNCLMLTCRERECGFWNYAAIECKSIRAGRKVTNVKLSIASNDGIKGFSRSGVGKHNCCTRQLHCEIGCIDLANNRGPDGGRRRLNFHPYEFRKYAAA